MATRQELLQTFNRYTNEELAKLIVIGDSILNPNLGQLTSVDFASIVDSVFKAGGWADTYFPQWTDRSKSDFGRFLVELFALISDKDMFYINHFSKEAFGTTAELYRSLVHKATSNGFKPPSNKSAVMDVDVTFQPTSSGETVPRGTILIGLQGSDDLFTFTNDEFTIPSSGINQTLAVPFSHGVYKSLSGSFNGRSIIITDENVCELSVKLDLNGDASFVETQTFALGAANTKHFMVFYNELGQAEVIFPKGGFGVYPVLNTPFTLTYRVGGGAIGNIASAFLNVLKADNTATGIVSFVQNEDALGGTNLLPLETLRQRAIGFQRNLNRAVSDEDVETICKELQWVKNAKSINISNYSFLFVVPVGSQNISPTQGAEVEDYFLTPHSKLGMGRALLVSSASYVAITAVIDVYILSGFSNAGAQAVANEVVQDYLDAQRYAKFGAGVVRSLLASLIISNVAGAQNVDFTTLYVTGSPASPADIVVENTQLIDWDNSSVTVNIIGGQ